MADPRQNLSKTPSWIMVGFVLGVMAVLGFQHETAKPETAAVPQPVSAPADVPPTITAPKAQPEAKAANVTSLTDQPSLAVIEAVFSEWGGYASWESELTEVALWNSQTGGFTDYFEVRQTGDTYYFRSIPRLTRPLTEGQPPKECPLRFTEPDAVRRAREEGRLTPSTVPGERPGPWREKPAPPAAPARPEYLPPTRTQSGEPKV